MPDTIVNIHEAKTHLSRLIERAEKGDTHAALRWWMNGDLLGAKIRAALADPANTIFFSAVSAYELAQKNRLGKLELPPELCGENLISAVVQEDW